MKLCVPDHAGNEFIIMATEGGFIPTSPAYISKVTSISSIMMYPSPDLVHTPQMTLDHYVAFISVYPSTLTYPPQVTQDSSVSSISAHPITINTLQAIEDSSKSPTSAHPPTSSTYMLQVTQDSSVTSIGAHPSTSTPQVTQDSSVSSIGAHPSTSTPQATQGGSVSVTSEYPSTIYATQDSSVISIGAHPSTSSAFVQQIIRDTIRASSVKMQYSTTLVINNGMLHVLYLWPSLTIMCALHCTSPSRQD